MVFWPFCVNLMVNIYNKSCSSSLTEAGVGAGTDSYYEYVLKAYVLLGDEKYLYRFDKVRMRRLSLLNLFSHI